jgi:hypothetical protein
MHPFRYLLCLPTLLWLLLPPGLCFCPGHTLELVGIECSHHDSCPEHSPVEPEDHDDVCPMVKQPGIASRLSAGPELDSGHIIPLIAEANLFGQPVPSVEAPHAPTFHAAAPPLYLILRALRN